MSSPISRSIKIARTHPDCAPAVYCHWLRSPVSSLISRSTITNFFPRHSCSHTFEGCGFTFFSSPMTAQPNRPTNKRPRSDSWSSTTFRTAVRDDEFYHTSGDCIIRVEDTLFKVSSRMFWFSDCSDLLQIHRFIITRGSLIFSSLFELPQGSLAVEGMSDELPITLAGDTASDMRSLLKCIYAP
jgi:hypothetical protein